MPTGLNGSPAFSPKSSEVGSVENIRSSTFKPKNRPGSGTSVKTLNFGTTDLPFWSVTSLVSQSGRAWPSYGEPPMSTNVGLTVASGPSGAMPATSTVWGAPAQAGGGTAARTGRR